MEVQVPRPKQRYTEGKGHFHGNLLHDEEENVADKESTAESYLETEKGRCVCVCVTRLDQYWYQMLVKVVLKVLQCVASSSVLIHVRILDEELSVSIYR